VSEAGEPSSRVLDLFAVPGQVRPVPGGRGVSVVAGDLVLSPGRDAGTAAWLNPALARLAVDLDQRDARAVRLAVPVPARDGSWVVEGWGASRYEPRTAVCHDLPVLVATGRLLHAHLARAFRRPPPLHRRQDRWAVADRAAFSDPGALSSAVAPEDPRSGFLVRLAKRVDAAWSAPAQLVHGDLAGNVLLDAQGVPVVIDVSPYWRPVAWAEAVCVLDAVLWLGADARALEAWRRGAELQGMLRAMAFRVLSDGPQCDLARYRSALGRLVD